MLKVLNKPQKRSLCCKNRHFSTFFKLDQEFVDVYANGQAPKFGFNGLGEIAYLRSYARFNEEKGR